MHKILTLLTYSSFLVCFACSNPSLPTTTIEHYSLLSSNLSTNNKLVHQATIDSYKALDELASTRTQYRPFVQTVETIFSYSVELHQDIERLIQRLNEQSSSPNDSKTPTAIFITEGHGLQLQQDITALRTKYMNLINSLWENGGVKGTIMADPSKKERVLKEMNLEVPLKASFGSNKGTLTWSEYNFDQKPSIVTLLTLHRLQNLIYQTEAALVSFISGQCSPGCGFYDYDRLDIYTSSPKNHILLGETYETYIALGNVSSNKAQFYVNGKLSPKNKTDEYRAFRSTPKSIGEHQYEVMAIVQNHETNTLDTVSRTFCFNVHP